MSRSTWFLAPLFLLLVVGLLGARARQAEKPGEPGVPGEPVETKLMKKLTPLLTVDRVEPSVKFWTERFGFKKTMEVPNGDAVAFAAVERDGVEIMLQSWASLTADLKFMERPEKPTPAFLYLEVGDLEEVQKNLEGLDVPLGPRDTFYGMREITVREPGGHLVIFACRIPE